MIPGLPYCSGLVPSSVTTHGAGVFMGRCGRPEHWGPPVAATLGRFVG